MKIRRRRSIRMDGRTRDLLDAQREAFRVKFGRELGPGDPLFFDPDVDEPRPIEAEGVTAQVVRAMEEAGIHPRLIHGYRQTGLFVSGENIGRLGPREIADWRAALEEYDELLERYELMSAFKMIRYVPDPHGGMYLPVDHPARSLVRDIDGCWFLDPFIGIVRDNPLGLEASFQRMGNTIRSGLNGAMEARQLDVVAKHRWLAERFNLTVKRHYEGVVPLVNIDRPLPA